MDNLFKSILGEQLGAVVFVQNYLQLQFDGPILTCYTWPTVKTNLKSYDFNDIGYRDALCEIITKNVIDVILLDNKSLTIYFEDNCELFQSLIRDKSNKEVVEFAYFRGVDGEWFVLD